jgi:DNA-binding protein WhiA
MARGHFAVRVKEELAALRPGAPSERRALLAGLLRFAATLHLAGTVGPRVTLVLATESGGVARLAFWLLHAAYGVRPEFRMRTRGALVARARYEVVLAERVERVLGGAGILDGSGQLATGVPARLVRGRAAAACYARGAFLGRGSVTAPTRAPHLEIGMPDEHSARDLAALLARLDLPAAAGVRAGAHEETWRVVVKGGEAIGRTLATLGARDAYLSWEDGRIRREVRGEAVRLANADQANLRRSVAAAMAQVAAVERAVTLLGWERLPEDLATVATLRLAHPDATLAELGAALDPPRSKGAVHARLRRLEALAGTAEDAPVARRPAAGRRPPPGEDSS